MLFLFNTCSNMVLRLISLVVIGLSFFPSEKIDLDQAAPVEENRRVLILNSYHSGMTFSDEEVRGVRAALPKNVEFVVEYMDTKRISTPEYFKHLKDLYQFKYTDVHLDAVVTLDDDAFQFMLTYGADLFPGVPVVFCGVNRYDPAMLEGHPNITGVVETIDIAESIRLGLKLYPRAKTVLAITDNTTTGKVNRAILEDLAASGQFDAQFVFLDPGDGVTLQELLDKLQASSPDSIVYYADFFRDRNGISYNPEDTMPLVSEAAPGPVFTHAELYLDLGAAGGKVNAGFYQGEMAGMMVAQIFEGREVSKIPVQTTGVTRYMFDDRQLARWGIDDSLLPPGSDLHFARLTFFEQYRELIIGVALVVVCMGGIILMLALNIFRRRAAQRALSASQKHYKQLANLLPLSVFESNETGRITFANQCFLENFGHTPQNLEQGLNLIQVVVPEDRERVREDVFRAMNGETITEEYTALRRDGSTFPIQVTSTARLVESQIVGLRGVLIDLSSRKQTEEEIRRSEQRFRSIVETSPIGMHIYQLQEDDNLVLVGANPAADRILKIAHRNLLGLKIQEAFPGIDQTNMPGIYRKIAREGGVFSEEQVNYQDENLAGAFEVHVFQIAPGMSTGMFMDITDRIRSAAEIQDALARFEAVIANTPVVAIQGFNRVGIVRHWNTASERIYGFSSAEALGKNIQELLFTPDTGAEFSNLLENIWQSGMPVGPREWQVTDASGMERWVLSTIFPILEQGKVAEVFCMDVDITDRRRAEEELRFSEQRYRTLFEKAQDAIFVETMDDKIVDANPSACEMVGYTLEELKSIQISDLLVSTRGGSSVIQEELEQYQGRVFEGQDLHKSGKAIDVEVSTSKISDNLALSIVRDITERKHNEKILRKLNRALRTISECNQILVRVSVENDLLDQICQAIHKNGGYRFVWVGFAMSNHSISPVSYAGYEAGYLKAVHLFWGSKQSSYSPMATAIHTIQPALVSDIQSKVGEDASWAEEARKRGYAAILALPLFYNQEVYGSLGIYADQPDAFNTDEIALLKELADDLSYGIHSLRIRADNRLANEMLRRSSVELERAYDATLEGWSRALELRERETAGHSRRVVELSLQLGRQMGMNSSELEHLRRGSLLHDIGKMGIPDNVLLKPGPLTDDEWIVMRQHPVYAYQLLTGIPYLEQALQVPYSHHERWNGSGYPLALKGKDIPFAARIFAVVDVWDALSSDRPYRPAWPVEDVRSYLLTNADVLFDPQVVEIFLKLVG